MTIPANRYFRILVVGSEHARVAEIIVPGERYDSAAKPMVDYFLVFEEGANLFPGFSYEVQGVYQGAEDARTRFYTYVVKE
jgi:ornithine decarboxylase